MRRFKYIIVHDIAPRLFSEMETHSDVARGLQVDSAGFGSLDYEPKTGQIMVQAWGGSVSLKVESHPGDAELIARMFNEPRI